MTIYTRPDSVPAWAESGAKVQPSDSEIQAGWPATNVPPSRQRFNWILGWLAQAVRYFLQFGIPEWAANETYATGARVQHGGTTYKAIASSTNVEPGTDAAKWEKWGFLDSEIQPRVDKLLTKSVAGNSDVTLSAAEAENGILVFTGALTGNINVIIPNAARRFVVHNGTSGSFSLSVKTATGTAVAIPQSTTKSVVIYCDGSNNVRIAGSANDAAIQVVPFTATAGQTSFSVAYTPGTVFLAERNGANVGFTASNGSAVVLDVAAGLNDIVKVYIAAGFQVANAVSKGGDTMTGNLTGPESSSTTLAGLVRLATSAEAQAFSNSARALTPATLAAALQGSNQSLATSGYQKLPGGLIVQWGTQTLAVTSVVNVSLPIAFPNMFLNAQSNNGTNATSVNAGHRAIRVSNSQIGLQTNNSSMTIDWVAIGY